MKRMRKRKRKRKRNSTRKGEKRKQPLLLVSLNRKVSSKLRDLSGACAVSFN